MNARVILGDCLEVMRGMESGSVDAIVTDPPYGLSFMGKKWDYDVPSEAIWRECLRLLKPGGHLLAFAGTRTQHRMAVRIEDAGFEIRDMIAWVYGSGFPKSHNGEWGGTALKPALEPITVARKPLQGTVAQTYAAHGTGSLNIDGCRVDMGDEQPMGSGCRESWRELEGRSDRQLGNGGNITPAAGRWPANLIHDGSPEVLALFPDAKGAQAPVSDAQRSRANTYGAVSDNNKTHAPRGDTGTAARFFYCAKASRKDRNEGLGAGGPPAVGQFADMREREDADWAARNPNHHPTVKPTDLMRYLCRLVTPAGGTVLDPFMGSGSTGKAAVLEGFGFIGIELDPAYHAIAEQRVQSAQPALLTTA